VRSPGWTVDAVLTLDGLVDGPVHVPYGPDAAVELAVGPALPALTARRLIAVVGATGTADVARVLRWAAESDIEVVLPGAVRTTRRGNRPVVALSLSRADRVVADPGTGLVRAGVGAAWSAVHRAAEVVTPRDGLARPGTIGATLAATTLGPGTFAGAVVVTGDGVVHTLSDGVDDDLWWAFRAQPGAVGVVTAVLLDARRRTTTAVPRDRTRPSELVRLVHLARRHDPDGRLGVPSS
jgi:hypothetical protein